MCLSLIRTTSKFRILILGIAVAGCFSQSKTAIEACKVAFQSSNTVDVAKFAQSKPYTFEGQDKLVVNFYYVDDNAHRSPTQAECEIVTPIQSGDAPELLRMNVNGNYFSEDKVIVAQSAIIKWIEKQK